MPMNKYTIVLLLPLLSGGCAPHPPIASIVVSQPVHGAILIPENNALHIPSGAYYMAGTISTSPEMLSLTFRYAKITCSGIANPTLNGNKPSTSLTCSDGQHGMTTETHASCDKSSNFDGGTIELSNGITGSFDFGPPLYSCAIKV